MLAIVEQINIGTIEAANAFVVNHCNVHNILTGTVRYASACKLKSALVNRVFAHRLNGITRTVIALKIAWTKQISALAGSISTESTADAHAKMWNNVDRTLSGTTLNANVKLDKTAGLIINHAL